MVAYTFLYFLFVLVWPCSGRSAPQKSSVPWTLLIPIYHLSAIIIWCFSYCNVLRQLWSGREGHGETSWISMSSYLLVGGPRLFSYYHLSFSTNLLLFSCIIHLPSHIFPLICSAGRCASFGLSLLSNILLGFFSSCLLSNIPTFCSVGNLARRFSSISPVQDWVLALVYRTQNAIVTASTYVS